MGRRNELQRACVAGILWVGLSSLVDAAPPPNLLIIHTDEHNFRTLGCYREQMRKDQAFVWGEGVKVDTPNIDSIAHDGALCTSCYAASPVCTPSRAALVSGRYPVYTGSPINDMPMHDDVITFAEILKRNGYATSYVGKWHLDGVGKPEFAPKRQFGWTDNRYMFNRGHWKLLKKSGNTAALIGNYNPRTEHITVDIGDADETSFTTDFLANRAIEILERDKSKPFCLMLAFPDPHGPNTVRKPYDTMFESLHFENPRTMDVDEGTMPKWVSLTGKNAVKKLNQAQMARYFGMVKCIDDNVGKILNYLKSQGLEKNTIVVFTSDHGDLMGEHKRNNKGLPYETSACIPFLVRYPGKILPSKVIHTAQCNVDFAPTMLSMMGITNGWPEFHGKNILSDFLSLDKEVNGDRVVYFTNAASRWVAAVSDRYKLVLSPSDNPWLFDLQKDPDEMVNFYNNPEYKPVVDRMQTELISQMKRYQEPALEKVNLIYETGGSGGEKPDIALATSEGYLVDGGNYSAKGKPGQWSRAITVPAGSFEPNSTYELVIEWESKGLDENGEFFANFIAGKKDKKNRQIKTWTGVAGERGVVRKQLKTTSSKDWTLHVGVKNGGELLVKRIQIRKTNESDRLGESAES